MAGLADWFSLPEVVWYTWYLYCIHPSVIQTLLQLTLNSFNQMSSTSLNEVGVNSTVQFTPPLSHCDLKVLSIVSCYCQHLQCISMPVWLIAFVRSLSVMHTCFNCPVFDVPNLYKEPFPNVWDLERNQIKKKSILTCVEVMEVHCIIYKWFHQGWSTLFLPWKKLRSRFLLCH